MIKWCVEVLACDNDGKIVDISVKALYGSFTDSFLFKSMPYDTKEEKTETIKKMIEKMVPVTVAKEVAKEELVSRTDINKILSDEIKTNLTNYKEAVVTEKE